MELRVVVAGDDFSSFQRFMKRLCLKTTVCFYYHFNNIIILKNEIILFRDESKNLVEIFLHCIIEGFVSSRIEPKR